MVVLNMSLVVGLNIFYGYYKLPYAVPYSVVLISFLSSFLLLFNYRLLIKYFFSYYKDQVLKRSRVLIFGASQTGIITRHVIDSSMRMRMVGFLEDDPDKIGKVMDGVKMDGVPSILLKARGVRVGRSTVGA